MYRRLVFLWLAVLCCSCDPGKPLREAESAAPFPPSLVVAAGMPFWFELGPGGPRLIPSPGEASLEPFVPWSRARFIAGFIPAEPEENPAGNTGLFAGVNRWGILGFESREGETALYYYPGGPVWENYPAAALFRYEQKPAVLLRGDFFSSGRSAPVPALWTTGSGPASAGTGMLEALRLPVLDPFPPGEGWETAAFFHRGDYWYFRESRSGTGPACYRTPDPAVPGDSIGEAVFLDAAAPQGPELAPPLLALAMEEAERLAGRPCTVTAVSPGFPSGRVFRSSLPAPDEGPELSAYYRSAGGELALVLFPGGKGVFCRSGAGGSGVEDGHFTLPALPAGRPDFRYTHIAAAGNVLVVSWEEQENWTVGAAGFLLLEINW
ncbi:MAG: hypothetical protein LBK77_06900 [Spirochaetaceae bacterium]|jgi:hypothetical protein|nr:hypothetical protein [Spirochaetaceae bacterium]